MAVSQDQKDYERALSEDKKADRNTFVWIWSVLLHAIVFVVSLGVGFLAFDNGKYLFAGIVTVACYLLATPAYILGWAEKLKSQVVESYLANGFAAGFVLTVILALLGRLLKAQPVSSALGLAGISFAFALYKAYGESRRKK